MCILDHPSEEVQIIEMEYGCFLCLHHHHCVIFSTNDGATLTLHLTTPHCSWLLVCCCKFQTGPHLPLPSWRKLFTGSSPHSWLSTLEGGGVTVTGIGDSSRVLKYGLNSLKQPWIQQPFYSMTLASMISWQTADWFNSPWIQLAQVRENGDRGKGNSAADCTIVK